MKNIEKAWSKLGKKFGNLPQLFQEEIQQNIGFNLSKEDYISDAKFISICRKIETYKNTVYQIEKEVNMKIDIDTIEIEKLFALSKERLSEKENFYWFYMSYKDSMQLF